MIGIAIGIDPGKRGAIGYLRSGGYGGVIDSNMETLTSDLTEITEGIKWGAAVCAIEKQSSWGLNDRLQGKRLSNFLIEYGTILANLKILGIEVIEVPPRTWQSAILGRVPAGETKTASVAYACRIAPWLKDKLKAKTRGRADAICLAEYARQTSKLRGMK